VADNAASDDSSWAKERKIHTGVINSSPTATLSSGFHIADEKVGVRAERSLAVAVGFAGLTFASP
jgi:hypothetical protein